MIPHERSLVEELKDKPFVLLGINSDDDPKKFLEDCKEEKITWPSFFDGGFIGGPIAKRWGVNGWPTTYVLDKKGVIRFTNLRDKEMAKAVKDLLAGN
jgi:peroxiredoxin